MISPVEATVRQSENRTKGSRGWGRALEVGQGSVAATQSICWMDRFIFISLSYHYVRYAMMPPKRRPPPYVRHLRHIRPPLTPNTFATYATYVRHLPRMRSPLRYVCVEENGRPRPPFQRSLRCRRPAPSRCSPSRLSEV